MRFFGWVFLVLGILSVLLTPFFSLLLIIMGAILISIGRKGKDRRLARKARKMRYKATKARKEGDVERAEYFEVKAKKYE